LPKYEYINICTEYLSLYVGDIDTVWMRGGGAENL
jgi:hypothetical protein